MSTGENCKKCGAEIRGEICAACADESDNSYEAEGYIGCVLKFAIALLVFVVSFFVYSWMKKTNPENSVAPSIPFISGVIVVYYAKGLYTLWKNGNSRNRS